VFSPLFHLHTNIYQHSWKWSVIDPYHYVDIYILCIYAGVDALNLVVKSRQQNATIFKGGCWRYPPLEMLFLGTPSAAPKNGAGRVMVSLASKNAFLGTDQNLQ